MKKSILYLLFLCAFFTACDNKDDTVFEETADARLNAALASYEKQLIEAPYGWNAVIYPGGGGTYGFHFKFDEKNRVTMYSDFSDETAAKSKESSYRLKAVQTPVLIFDTYSYLHILADPDKSVNGGETGLGLQSDFEFSIFPDSVKAESITLVGRKNNSRLVLTKATQAQVAAYAAGDLADAVLFNNITKYQAYFKRVTLGNVTYEITLSPSTRTIKLTWLDGSVPRTFTTSYYFTAAGVSFTSPLVNGSQTINGFTNVTWNANAAQVGVTAAGVKGTIVGAIKPLSVDLAAARRWWQEPIESGGYWTSWMGFHVNGVDDALKVQTLKVGDLQYYSYLYQPASDGDIDIFGPLFYENQSLSLEYGHGAGRPTFTSDGRIVFSQVATYGNLPTSGPAIESAKFLFEASGHYLIQTSETTYDMVSAKDAKSWIAWE
ncbi:DUF4302 domain-containing protein [Dyadobacter chenwenxiniae]|uniref:DUF4302 domain-containing protein n=1 Tax=Dyadobacter chenwenxiniae TaxID=2906456 RepID=A0A9X1PJF6_9BACT|nr:DUF4302 domain-containing protein [Dyadobacter chenwenxiniae]MCF0061109.1 DUF4302 domain-containing protein [Dyadobacter chenwenxiniae]UON80936.1 DUF4302 domain-containing protein [Dyadobacter chenwenxiniae]